MNPAALLLPRVYVLVVRFDTTDRWYASRLGVEHHKTGENVTSEELIDPETSPHPGMAYVCPLLVLVYGQGVITKRTDQAGEIIARVTAQRERFAWSVHQQGDTETFSFVQHSQMAPVEKWLEAVPVIDTRYIAPPQEKELSEIARARVQEFYAGELSWRRLIRPSHAGALLGSMIAARARLPMLGIVLLLLVANYFYGAQINARRQALQLQVKLLQDRQGTQERLSEQKESLLSEFNRRPPYPYSLLCDRIAAVVPGEMTLSELSVQPLSKTLENLAPVKTEENTLTIAGSALSGEAVAQFSERLKKERFVQGLTLSRLEQQPESGLFRFTIQLAL